MKKPFMEVFPTLQLREELKSVLEFASIDRITMNWTVILCAFIWRVTS